MIDTMKRAAAFFCRVSALGIVYGDIGQDRRGVPLVLAVMLKSRNDWSI